jgi:hypothetical protein
MYSEGTIKLTWIDSDDRKILHSKMFKTIEEATKETKDKKNWLIFKLKNVNGDSYSWDLLPYGASRKYQLGMAISDNQIIMLTSLTLIGFGVFYIYKLFKD